MELDKSLDPLPVYRKYRGNKDMLKLHLDAINKIHNIVKSDGQITQFVQQKWQEKEEGELFIERVLRDIAITC